MICNNCGAELKDTAKFCNKCGARITSDFLKSEVTESEDELSATIDVPVETSQQSLSEHEDDVLATKINTDIFINSVSDVASEPTCKEPPPEQTVQAKETAQSMGFFHSLPIVILLTIFVWPIGLILLVGRFYKKGKIKDKTRTILDIAIIAFFLFLCFRITSDGDIDQDVSQTIPTEDAVEVTNEAGSPPEATPEPSNLPKSDFELMMETAENDIEQILAEESPDLDKLFEAYSTLLGGYSYEYMFKTYALMAYELDIDDRDLKNLVKDVQAVQDEMLKYFSEDEVGALMISMVRVFDSEMERIDYDSLLIGTKKHPDLDAMWEAYTHIE